ncbi:Mitochondrial import inner membrane translocase subunit Tim21 protein [Dioscorea alata]|uniref:Mitochondrial import inner membrane translocase subunit Tim21 protein n=1 Tax=Dioscorea alata TaxID=55571 RepID=A0ACB7WI37_DIOAL|nr:Mitochondrial import inner membrane translocase subunit Tim21 protein [Dioscorea alata]
MHQLKQKGKELGFLIRARWLFSHDKKPLGFSQFVEFSSAAIGRQELLTTLLAKSTAANRSGSDISRMLKGTSKVEGISLLCSENFGLPPLVRYSCQLNGYHQKHRMLPRFTRAISSSSSQNSREGTTDKETMKDVSKVEDPFDDLTYDIPEKPVTFAEGASYSVVILAGLGIAGLAAYAVFKELIFEPKEYKIFGKALERVQNDNQVTVRIGSPVTGYGQESRNRAARQRIPNRVWTDEDGVEHVEVNFHIRGPHGAGVVYTEMFKDNADKKWKFTYLIVEIKSPTKAQLMLESYVPA